MAIMAMRFNVIRGCFEINTGSACWEPWDPISINRKLRKLWWLRRANLMSRMENERFECMRLNNWRRAALLSVRINRVQGMQPPPELEQP